MTARTEIVDLDRRAQAGTAKPIAQAMSRLRSAARRRLLVERSSWILALGIAAVVGVIAVDYVVRLPGPLRMVLWAVGVVLASYGIVRAVLPAWRFRPSLVEVALRVERTEEARRAGLDGRLATAIELAGDRAAGESVEMAGAAVREAIDRFGGLRVTGALLVSGRAQRGLGSLAVALLPLLAGFLVAPVYTRIGLTRAMIPWRETAWPKRTMVLNATNPGAHPLDSALTLRSVVTRSNRAIGKTDVTMVYRVVVDGKPGPETRILLNAAKIATNNDGKIDAYEAALSREAIRLAAGLAAEESADRAERVFEYSFHTADDETDTERITLVERPKLAAIRASVTPPVYASKSPVVVAGESPVVLDATQRGTVGPVLAGSRIELVMGLSKAVPTPGTDGPRRGEHAPLLAEWVASTFPGSKIPEQAAWDLRADRWTLSWIAAETVSLSLRPVDEHGISAADESAIVVSVAADAPPGAVVMEPVQDESVLATAIVPLSGEGRDDVGLASVTLDVQRHAAPSDSPGAPPAPFGEPTVVASIVDPPLPEVKPGVIVTPTARVRTDLNLGELTLSPGDEVWVAATAVDGFDLDGARHDPVRSNPRKLRIISEAQLSEQILDELVALKSVAERLDQDQASLTERTRQASAPGEARASARDIAREQRAVADRLAPARELLERASRRAERNGLSDQSLRSLLEQAQQHVEHAAESAQRAAEAVDRVAETPADQPASPEPADTARREQDRVRDDMVKLNDLLSRGRDGWAARQSVDRLLGEQRDLIEQTRRASEATAGRRPEELTPEQRGELDRVARAQDELARKARQATEDLLERARRVKQDDPAQAQAMEQAAQQAMREQLAEQMQQAAEQSRENQTGQAQERQEQAAETLEQMLEQLDRAQQRRDEALQRTLATLIKSIEGLIGQQQRELASLAEALTKAGPLAPLAPAMVALHGNTLAVSDSTEVREAAEILRRLEAAADHQDTAAASLKDPPQAAVADENERLSLKRLEEARDIAKQKESEARDRDQSRKRNELRAEYAKIAQLQDALNSDTLPYVGKEIGRRERNTVRTLGERQAAVRDQLAQLREKTEGLSQSTMFEYAHKRLNTATSGAADTLTAGEAPTKVARQQAEASSVLRSMLQALKQSEPPKNDFRQQQQGGEQQQNQGDRQQQQQQQNGVVPPMAELLVLKEMQIEAAKRTRDAGNAVDAEEVAAIGQLQRDLAELGRKVIDLINQQNAPPADKPGPPAPPPAPPQGDTR